MFAIDEAGMRQFAWGESYQAFRGGVCFAVERVATDMGDREEGEAGYDPDPEHRKRQVEAVNAAYRTTEKIAESFRFLRP